MQPGSLVFLVIMAIWAAYFLQHWVRRREHLATARSIEEFSDSMRVLERRGVLPVSSLSEPAPHSWSVSPARSTRPVVTVKRAEEAPAPLASRSGAYAAARPARPAAPEVSGPTRRTLGLTLLGSLVTLLVLLPVVALTALTWPFALLPLVSGGYAFAALRMRTQAETRARRVARPARPRTAARRGGATVATASEAARAPQAPARDRVFDLAATETVAAPAERAERLPERQAATAGRPTVTRPQLDEDDMPLTWDPVPVPRPTYTMKAAAPQRATRPVPAPSSGASVDPAPRRRVVGE